MEKHNEKPFGEILIELKIISREQLDYALQQQQKEKGKYLGEILIGMGIGQERINQALDRFQKRKPIGQVLLDLKILNSEQLKEVLEKQKQMVPRKPLGVLLVQMGYITYEDLMKALSKHFNMPINLMDLFLILPSKR
jgi:hypothetical protein